MGDDGPLYLGFDLSTQQLKGKASAAFASSQVKPDELTGRVAYFSHCRPV